ncbi:hypothetical protein [Bacillus halotolerans]|uniref:hypothetical protein n=1 Tax=Bacillus halotolerans TaxID=260554 RepID=UPI0039F6AA93
MINTNGFNKAPPLWLLSILLYRKEIEVRNIAAFVEISGSFELKMIAVTEKIAASA